MIKTNFNHWTISTEIVTKETATDTNKSKSSSPNLSSHASKASSPNSKRIPSTKEKT